jgi:hypothetical protein
MISRDEHWVERGDYTKYDHMSNTDIFQGSSSLINKHIVELVKRVEALHDMSEDCMAAVQVLEVVRKRKEEL